VPIGIATSGIPYSLFNAYTVLAADADNTPLPLTVGASTIVGRAATGGIVALTPNEAFTVIGLGTMAWQSAAAVNIDGGAIDGTTVGSSVAAAVTGTVLNVSQGVGGTWNADAALSMIQIGTADTADDKGLALCGGGAVANTRGGMLTLFGNEHASKPCVGRLESGLNGVSSAALEVWATVGYMEANGVAVADWAAGRLNVTGDLTFSGTARKITGDMSNGTRASRLQFQTSTTNGNTNLGVCPNGTGTISAINVLNGTNWDAAGSVGLYVDSAGGGIVAGTFGGGAHLPFYIQVGGNYPIQCSISNETGIGGAAVGGAALTAYGTAYVETTKRVACGGGSTGATTTPNGTVTLEINGSTYYLLKAAGA